MVGKLDPMSCFVTAEWKCWRVSDGEPSSRGSFVAVVQFDSGTWGQTAMKFEHEELQLSQGQNGLPFSRANLCRTVSY